MASVNPILVTGAAGFIGFHVARRLVEAGRDVIGVDNLSPYYDPTLKEARLQELAGAKNFKFVRLLKGGQGTVVDVKSRLDRAHKPEGIDLWRL